MNISLDEGVMSEILGLPTKGTKSLRKEKCSENFLKISRRLFDMNIKNVNKKDLKDKY